VNSYLGRMLRTAVGGESRLHPLAGSVYGDPEAGASHSAPPQGTEVIDDQREFHRDRASAPAHHSEDAATAVARPLGILEAYQPLQPLRREPGAQRQYSEKPRATVFERPLTAPDVGANALGAEATQVHAEAHLISGTRVSQPTSFRPNGTLKDEPSAELIDRRLTSERKDPSPGISAKMPVTTSSRAPVVGQQGVRHASPRNTGAGEPDVQVHIGRIEVLAVQPPPPTMAAPRRERSTSLVDYLTSRNGRGR
jgi:hypothetical protein